MCLCVGSMAVADHAHTVGSAPRGTEDRAGLQVPVQNGEGLQVLHYQIGELYQVGCWAQAADSEPCMLALEHRQPAFAILLTATQGPAWRLWRVWICNAAQVSSQSLGC